MKRLSNIFHLCALGLITSFSVSSVQANVSLIEDLRESARISTYESYDGGVVTTVDTDYPPGQFEQWQSLKQSSSLGGQNIVGYSDFLNDHSIYVGSTTLEDVFVVNPNLPSTYTTTLINYLESKLGPIDQGVLTPEQYSQLQNTPEFQSIQGNALIQFGHADIFVEDTRKIGELVSPEVDALSIQAKGQLQSYFGNSGFIDVTYDTSTVGGVFAFSSAMRFSLDGSIASQYGSKYAVELMDVDSGEVVARQSAFTPGGADLIRLEDLIVGPGTYQLLVDIGGFSGGSDIATYELSAVFSQEVPLPPALGFFVLSLLGLASGRFSAIRKLRFRKTRVH